MGWNVVGLDWIGLEWTCLPLRFFVLSCLVLACLVRLFFLSWLDFLFSGIMLVCFVVFYVLVY